MKKHNQICKTRGNPLRFAAAVLVLMLSVAVISGCTPDDSSDDFPFGAVQSHASSKDLYCLEFTSYSGPFVEDGTNDPVENVLALLLENRSKEYLELATITYQVDGETAEFVVSGLPPEKKVWVLEKNRMPAKESSEFEFTDCESTFRSDAVLTTKKLEVKAEESTITIKNVSKDTLNNPCIYYKNLNSDGNFLGGITYMVGFDTLKPDDTLEKQAGHYFENSRIVRYSYQTE